MSSLCSLISFAFDSSRRLQLVLCLKYTETLASAYDRLHFILSFFCIVLGK